MQDIRLVADRARAEGAASRWRACAFAASLQAPHGCFPTIGYMKRFLLTIAASLASAALLVLSVPASASDGSDGASIHLFTGTFAR